MKRAVCEIQQCPHNVILLKTNLINNTFKTTHANIIFGLEFIAVKESEFILIVVA